MWNQKTRQSRRQKKVLPGAITLQAKVRCPTRCCNSNKIVFFFKNEETKLCRLSNLSAGNLEVWLTAESHISQTRVHLQTGNQPNNSPEVRPSSWPPTPKRRWNTQKQSMKLNNPWVGHGPYKNAHQRWTPKDQSNQDAPGADERPILCLIFLAQYWAHISEPP